MAFSATAARDSPCPGPPADGVSSLSWSPTANLLVAGSWDNSTRCWEVQAAQNAVGQITGKAQTAGAAPVLDTAFASDGASVFIAAADNTVKQWHLQSNQVTQVAAHDAPVRTVSVIPQMNCIATGSWDKTVKYWDTRSPTPVGTLALAERVYALDVRHPLMAIACGGRQVVMVDMNKPTAPFKVMESPLRFQLRTVACFPDASGFALGSIEGRCAIHHVMQPDRNFAFKAHRDGNTIYPVNGIAFHPFGTFATCGGDGTWSFWDSVSKQRLKAAPRMSQSQSAIAWNAPGDMLAYGVSYDWSRGAQPQTPSEVWIHHTPQAEIKQRKKAAGRK